MNTRGNISGNSRRVAKNTLLLYFRMLLMMFIGLFTSRAVLQSLGVEDVGVYNAVAGVVTMFTLLSNSIAQAISRFITYALGRNDEARLRKVFSTSLTIQLILSVLLILLAETLGVWFLESRMNIPAGREHAAFIVLQCSLATLVIQLFSIPFNAVIIAHERMGAFAYISILEAFLKLGIALYLSLSPFDVLLTYAVLMMAAAFIVRCTYAVYCRRHFAEAGEGIRFHKDVLREMGSFSGWNFFGSSAYVVNTQGINLLVNVFFGVALNAARGYATQVEGIVKQFVTNFLTALNPQITKSFASGNRKYAFELVEKGSRFTFVMLLAFSVPVFLEAPYLLHVWLGTVPEHTDLFVRLILVGTMADMVFNPLLTLELATGDIKRYYLITGVIAYLALPVSWALLRCGAGAYVPYLVFAGVYLVVDVAKVLILRRQVGLPSMWYVKSAIMRPAAAASVASIPAVGLWFVMGEGLPRLFAVLLVFLSCLSAAVWHISMTEGEKAFASEWLRKKLLGLVDRLSSVLPDRLYLQLKHRLMLGYRLDLKHPRSFNEKVQWMKLYDRNPLYVRLVDKAEAKGYVESKIGEGHTIPTLGLWNSASEIDFESLPDSFVLKCTHDSGSIEICRDKSSFDRTAATARLDRALSMNYYQSNREWPYKHVTPRIIAEEYVQAADEGIPDYKFLCFNGEPRVMFVATERFSQEGTKFDFFDMDFNHLPFTGGHPCAEREPRKPEHFEEMKDFCRVLSKGMPQVRIDFYEVDGKVLFGEFTFSHMGGMSRFEPEEWDFKLGQMIRLGNE